MPGFALHHFAATGLDQCDSVDDGTCLCWFLPLVVGEQGYLDYFH
jgi:hypothetical protein